MGLHVSSTFTEQRSSLEAGKATAAHLKNELGCPPKIVFVYLTVKHNARAFLSGIREVLGEDVRIAGCCTQGVMANGVLREEGYAASLMALGGESLHAATARALEIQTDTARKGTELGRELLDSLGGRTPKVAIVQYDPLSGVDAAVLLRALYEVLQCPIMGGAASHPSAVPVSTTQQYFGGEVTEKSAVVSALVGEFTAEFETCMGCSPVGVEMIVTKARDNMVLELDGRRALDVWQELTSSTPGAALRPEDTAALAIGVKSPGGSHMIRAAFLLDHEAGGFVLQAAIPTGERVMLFHRTVEDVLDGAHRLGATMREKLHGKTPRAAFGFECAARTLPFLGADRSLQENVDLQRDIATEIPWVGFTAWGEVCPLADGSPAFHNYTYPLLILAE